MKNTIMIMGAVCVLTLTACGDEDLSDKSKATVEKVVKEVAEVVEPDKEPAVKVSPLYSMTRFQQQVVMSKFNWVECDKWVKASKASRLVDFTKARHEKCSRLFDDLNTFSEKVYGMSFTTAQWPSEDELAILWVDSEKAADACEIKNGFDACNLVLTTQIRDLSSVESIY